jgi:hypothetical protein
MISMLAIDGYDKVSLGEFMVFVADSNHQDLEKNIQQQLAEQLERQGRDYQIYLYNSFWGNTGEMNGDQSGARESGLVDTESFKQALLKIGLRLTSSDVDRLVTRFCLHDQNLCSVSRFLRMAQNNKLWRHGEKVLAYKEEAIEEAAMAMARLREGVEMVPGLTEEIISMSEYLGIRVLSEPSLLWIAVDAYSAPLPSGWATHRDAEGRMFFHNATSNASQWDHPLDSHFRQ